MCGVQARCQGPEYDELVTEFIEAANQVYGQHGTY